MNPVKVMLVLMFSILTLLGGYALIVSIVANSCSMFFVAGALMCVAGVFCLIEDRLCKE